MQTFCRHCAEALRRAERFETERAARDRRALARLARDDVAEHRRRRHRDRRERLRRTHEPHRRESDRLAGGGSRGKLLAEVFPIFNEHTREEVESPVAKVLREGTVVGLANHTVLLSRNRMAETPIEDSGTPVRGQDQAIEGVVLVFRDTSLRRREIRRAFLAQATAALSESLDYQVTLTRVAELAVPQGNRGAP